MDNQLPSDLVSVGRAAKIIGCSPKQVYRWIRPGKKKPARLRAWKVAGSRYRVSRAEVEALIQPVPVVAPEPAEQQVTRREVNAQTRATLKRFGLA